MTGAQVAVPPGAGQVKALTTQKQRQELKQVLTDSPRDGWTPLAGALEGCRQLLTESSAPAGSSCWVFTDGKPEPETEKKLRAMREMMPALVEQGWHIYAIAFAEAEGAFAEFLEEIAASTGGAA